MLSGGSVHVPLGAYWEPEISGVGHIVKILKNCKFIFYHLNTFIKYTKLFQSGGAEIRDAVQAGILDLLLIKQWGIRLAANAAVTVLRVDQVGIKHHKTATLHHLNTLARNNSSIQLKC